MIKLLLLGFDELEVQELLAFLRQLTKQWVAYCSFADTSYIGTVFRELVRNRKGGKRMA